MYGRLRGHTDTIEEKYKTAKEKADKFDDLLTEQIKLSIKQENAPISSHLKSTPDVSKDHTQSQIE
ncbi:hypothetical protein [Lactiplantibacillus pentosus]|uniref:hypothetical protein n=1 Tax=Lactiplantibacillus pentosus TaxID=1589 RepID=UPI001FD6D432|nr:hypothetical protein [Lactiplantibacillus pentosus]MBU7449072.1 hypothetical protein [Lactiplantibacillus sp. 7.2.4]